MTGFSNHSCKLTWCCQRSLSGILGKLIPSPLFKKKKSEAIRVIPGPRCGHPFLFGPIWTILGSQLSGVGVVLSL